MSATLTPPAPIEAPVDVSAPRRQPIPALAPTDVERPARSTGRLRDALFFSAWVPALALASAVAAVALAVATPVWMARARYEQRQYR